MARLRPPSAVVEVGVGNDFEAAREFQRAGHEVLTTDVHPREPPPGIRFVLDDITAPELRHYAGAALVYGVRLPEELQASAARVAREVGALLAVRCLKDEWADVSMYFPRHAVLGDGWRLYTTTAPRSP